MSDDRVHSLADLESWHFEGVSLAVLGHPVAHSISPAMHNAALAGMAKRDPRFSRWRYFKFDVPPEELPRALPLFHARGFLGLNLTIPHKVIAVGLVRRIDDGAAQAGAVNTLRRVEDGFEGFNTDGYGISRAVQEDLGVRIAGASVVLLGAGGAARGAAVTCLHEKCAALWIGNRTAANLRALLRELAPIAEELHVPLRGFDLAAPPVDLPPDALVINATSSGLKPGDAPPIEVAALAGKARVYDMIYNPPETPLLRAARARGFPVSNGLSMLVHQGVRALEIWSGAPVPVEAMRSACLAALARKAGE